MVTGHTFIAGGVPEMGIANRREPSITGAAGNQTAVAFNQWSRCTRAIALIMQACEQMLWEMIRS